MRRLLTPEILDSIPPEHPDAVASRRDLRWIDRAMGNSRWLTRELREGPHPPGRCIELGAGEGCLAGLLSIQAGVEHYLAVDLAPPPEALPERIEWIQGDLLECTGYGQADTMIASLVLHHLDSESLSALARKIRNSSIRQILAAEPHRTRRHQHLARAGRWIGFNRVTLHDAPASVAAGFRGDELPEALTLSATEWDISVSTTITGAYRMAARLR